VCVCVCVEGGREGGRERGSERGGPERGQTVRDAIVSCGKVRMGRLRASALPISAPVCSSRQIL
jgi:hypothetical protein